MSGMIAPLAATVMNHTRVGFPKWHPHPDVWALIAVIEGAYLFALHRERSRPDRDGAGGVSPVATRWQVVAFSAGVLTLWIASDWPVHDLAEGYLYSVHMVQHLLMTLVAAPLLLLGTPAWLARRILSPRWLMATVKAVARPVPNLIQFNLVLVLSHWPVVVEGTLRHHPLHFVAHAVLLISALFMWLPIVSPISEIPKLAPLAQMVYLFLQTIIPTVPASFLTLGRTLLYPIYGTFPRLWGASALTDQQVAGLIMKIGAGAYLWMIIGVIFFKWYAREEAKPRDVLLWDDVERELQGLQKPGGHPGNLR
ncbi:MAG: cytochrome c oxidase assembly protein [Actinobacteria bacterium]|nr:cytochrome c oxidase assembly protein [Actinomycetota bacterium]